MKLAIGESNAKFKVQVDNYCRQLLFDIGDFVWVVLICERFLIYEYNKSREKKIGPCEVLQKINSIAYRL